jgi:4-hydroxybenzoate polyprenyltransferase
MTVEKLETIHEPYQVEEAQGKSHSLLDRENLVNIIKLARPRTWFFIYYSYIIGWLLGGPEITAPFLLGLVICVLSTANVNLLNAYTDIEEDQVNLPRRVMMIDRLGLNNLMNLVIILYGFTSVLALLMPFWFKVVYIASVFDTVFYSLEPLRLKARPLLSMVSFSGAVLLPGVASWTLNNDLVNTPPLLLFLGYMFFTYCVLKNLPDYDGDMLAGLRTSATVFKTREQASKVAAMILSSPFLVLAGLLVFGILAPKYGLLFVLLPLVLYLGRLAIEGDSYETLEKLHTFGLVYVVLFLVLTLLITTPTIVSMGFIASTLLIQAMILKNKLDSR